MKAYRLEAASGCYCCRCCLRYARAAGGEGEAVKLCPECYELAEVESGYSSSGRLGMSPSEVLKLIASVGRKGGSLVVWSELKRKALAAEGMAA